MKGFARVTKLSDIVGRADYISNPARQENIVVASAPVDWKPYQDFERANQKTDQRNNEGREIVVALPNEWRSLPIKELSDRAERLSCIAVGKSTDLQWAVHWNKGYTNLHLHIVFSERQRASAGKWDRDIYLTSDGKVARTKAERAKNADGTFKPPAHRKGEEKGGFTVKDTKYKARSWLPEMKEALRNEFQRMGVTMEEPETLRQFHEGKGKESARIRAKNGIIQVDNARLRELSEFNTADEQKTLIEMMKRGMKERKTVVLHFDERGNAKLASFVVPADAVTFARQTEQVWKTKIAGMRIGRLQEQVQGLRSEREEIDRRNKLYRLAVKCLVAVQEGEKIREEAKRRSIFTRKRFLAEHKDELDAAELAEKRLEKMDVHTNVDPEKVKKLIQQKEEESAQLQSRENALTESICTIEKELGSPEKSERKERNSFEELLSEAEQRRRKYATEKTRKKDRSFDKKR